MLKINRAIISVWDKQGVVEFARRLREFGVHIVSTGKTATLLRNAGVEVQEISEYTGFPEILNGRVKTIHASLYAGVLAKKGSLMHKEQLEKLHIPFVDMVVVNFYPFESMLKEQLGAEEMLEYIDIGGPALLRAAAKNFKSVAAVSSPGQYAQIMSQMRKYSGKIPDDTLQGLAKEAFFHTTQYDRAIHSFFLGRETRSFDFTKERDLRYGENPHQKAALYSVTGTPPSRYRQLQGKDLSFNNLLDMHSAFKIVRSFNEPAAAIVKHAGPCGVAVAAHSDKAYVLAFKSDPVASFGGIVGFNRKVDTKTARSIIKSGFKECVCSPVYSKEALKIFSQKKNMRVIEIELKKEFNEGFDVRHTAFGTLIQESDKLFLDKNSLKVVTRKKPSPRQLEDLLFGFRVVQQVKSNGIVVAKHKATLGIGAGQPSRIGSVVIALEKAGNRAKHAVLASDGFFPKEDSIIRAKKAGISAIIQPGGSVKDNDTIALCNRYGIAMVFTGIRHFLH